MAVSKSNLGNATTVSSMLRTDSVVVEIGGSIRRISLQEFTNSIQTGSLNLSMYAFGVPLKYAVQSGTNWGVVGNTAMWQQFKAQLGRYLLSADGTKMAKLSKNDSTVYADGTTVDETKGHIMFYGPRLYFLVKTDAVTGIPYLWGSPLPIGGHYVESRIDGAYKGYILNGKLVSRSGYAPSGTQTINSFFNYAKANGTNFGLSNYDFDRYMAMLNLFNFGNPNLQTNIGYGICGSVNKDLWAAVSSLLTGATKSLGDNCGKIDITVVNGSNTGVDCSRISEFGVEDRIGWQWEMRQNIYFGSSSNSGQTGAEVFLYEGNRMPTSAELASHPNGNYRQLTRVTSSNWIKSIIGGEYFDILAASLGGDSASYLTDFTNNSTTGQLCLFGGGANVGATCGAFCVNSGVGFSLSDAGSGVRLAYYGTPTIVNGANI